MAAATSGRSWKSYTYIAPAAARLTQQKHSKIVHEVYDYGIERRYPYNTLELLDGGDFSTRLPLAPQSA